jgi:hypothetical protein
MWNLIHKIHGEKEVARNKVKRRKGKKSASRDYMKGIVIRSAKTCARLKRYPYGYTHGDLAVKAILTIGQFINLKRPDIGLGACRVKLMQEPFEISQGH